MQQYKKEIIYIIIPLLFGIVSNTFLFLISPFFVQIGFFVFWIWVGNHFAKLSIHPLKSFLFGNSIWFLSFILFIWQFLIMDDNSRSMLLAGFSQFYMLPFIWTGTQLTISSSNMIDGNFVILYAYISMFITFIIGFVYGLIVKLRVGGK